jgi:sugar lactone lactonase YvrE
MKSVETVLRSVPLPILAGLTVDSDDNLVIASFGLRAVLVMDTSTGKIIRKITDPLITGPDDVAMGKDGSIYFTDVQTGVVGQIFTDGKIEIAVKLDPWVNGVRLSPSGDQLFVSHCIGLDRLTVIDLTGKAKPRVLAEGVGFPNSMAWGPDGCLYTPLNMKHNVVRWNTETGETEEVVNLGSMASGVKFDPQGRMLISIFKGEVWRYDLNTKKMEVLATNLNAGLDNVAVDSKGRIFASNQHGGIIEIFEDGSVKELSPQGLLIPSGLAVMQGFSGEQLLIADVNTLHFYDTKSMKPVRKSVNSGFYPWAKDYKGFGESSVNMVFPYTVSVDGNSLIISSWLSDAISVFDVQQGRVTRNIDGNIPLNAIAFEGNIIVSEMKTQSVVSISPNGERKTLASGIAVPSGLVAKGKDLWAADWSNGQIVKVVSNGEVLAQPTVVATGLSQPEGMAIAPDGSILVVESGAGRLLSVNPTSGNSTVLAENLKTGTKAGTSEAPTKYFSAVAVGADGSIYVSCDEGMEIVRMKGN